MTTPKVSGTMTSQDQDDKLYGQIYQEFDFDKSMGVLALAKELIESKNFERLFPNTKILFVQRKT